VEHRNVTGLARGLRRMVESKRLMVRRMTGLGLTEPAGTWQLLARLADGPARIGDLAQMFRCHMSVSSRLVAELQEHGLVNRVADPFDGRSHLVQITDAGRDYLQRYNAEVGRLVDAALAGWSDEDFERLVAGLNRLNDDFERALEGIPITA
jgi:DNA-binding MarR family transcriptional regulator